MANKGKATLITHSAEVGESLGVRDVLAMILPSLASPAFPTSQSRNHQLTLQPIQVRLTTATYFSLSFNSFVARGNIPLLPDFCCPHPPLFTISPSPSPPYSPKLVIPSSPPRSQWATLAAQEVEDIRRSRRESRSVKRDTHFRLCRHQDYRCRDESSKEDETSLVSSDTSFSDGLDLGTKRRRVNRDKGRWNQERKREEEHKRIRTR